MKSKSNSVRSAVASLFLVVLVACNATPPVSVKTGYDRTARFGKYHTYLLDVDSAGLAPITIGVLRDSLRRSLTAHGLNETSIAEADLYILTTIFTHEKLSVIPSGDSIVLPSGYGRDSGWSGRAVTVSSDVMQYPEGSLIINVVDRKTHKVVFCGLGQAAVGITKKNAAAIQEAVKKIVAAYPG